MKNLEIEREIAILEKLIAKPTTQGKEKEKLMKALEKAKSMLTSKSESVKEVTLKKEDKSIVKEKTVSSEYNCDELIANEKEKEKKRKLAAKERANAPKKSPATKSKEKVESVGDTIIERIEKGTATKSEITKTISALREVLKKLEKALSKL